VIAAMNRRRSVMSLLYLGRATRRVPRLDDTTLTTGSPVILNSAA
jgi:hypothetical protein